MASRRDGEPTLGLAPALPGVVLVLVIFWALCAVIMLTGTLINAREIDEDVAVINKQVKPIDLELNDVKEAGKTNLVAEKILKAAQPLSGQLKDVDAAANDIDKSAKAILATAGSINETARSINTTVTSIQNKVVSINGTVNSIGGSVNSIHGTVRSIFGRVVGIFRTVGPVNASDNSIKGSVASILRTFRSLGPEVTSIDRGVAAINGRAQRAIPIAAGLHTDLSQVFTAVGSASPGAGHVVNNIHGHVNSIDCAAILLGTDYCGQ